MEVTSRCDRKLKDEFSAIGQNMCRHVLASGMGSTSKNSSENASEAGHICCGRVTLAPNNSDLPQCIEQAAKVLLR